MNDDFKNAIQTTVNVIHIIPVPYTQDILYMKMKAPGLWWLCLSLDVKTDSL